MIVKSKDGTFRELRGRIGHFVFRTRNGQISITYAPTDFRSDPDAFSVRFREITKLLNLEIVATKRQNRALVAKKL